MDPFYWRLRYADGAVVTEPPENASICIAPRGAVDLLLCDATLKEVLRVPLEGKRPIFCRVRSMGYNMVKRMQSPVRLDATVFGRGWETDSEVKATLWAIVGGRVVDCPSNLVDKTMLELQVI